MSELRAFLGEFRDLAGCIEGSPVVERFGKVNRAEGTVTVMEILGGPVLMYGLDLGVNPELEAFGAVRNHPLRAGLSY